MRRRDVLRRRETSRRASRYSKEEAVSLLPDAINKAWISAYPGAPEVTDEKALAARVAMLADDRACWVKVAEALQTNNTALRSKL